VNACSTANRKLRRVLNGCGSDARIQYVDYVDGAGIPLFNQVCELDLEGIVAKQKHAPYVIDLVSMTALRRVAGNAPRHGGSR
jgi:hypothetical protein